jgi:4-azaleucine resistance transporter AzlC
MRIDHLSPSFRRGFRSVVPLSVAGVPFALAYVIAAKNAGLNALEIQLMSLTIYSAASQIVVVQMLSTGASSVTLIITLVVINLHYLLYGLSLIRRIKLARFQRIFVPFLLTDSVYGVTITEKRNENFAFLLGAELSLFLGWNLFTALGILFGNRLALFQWAHLDFVAPLTFFVLLISMLKTRLDFAVALLAAGLAGFCLMAGSGNLAVIVVGIAAPSAGIVISEFRKRLVS